MYYVIQVSPNEERKTVQLIKNAISRELCTECFFPMRNIRRKIRGELMDIREKLFPGYVFVESDNPKKLYEEIKKIPRLTKLLGVYYDETDGEFDFVELPTHEIAWLTQIISVDDDKTVPLSQVTVDAHGNIQIVSGVLRYLADRVIKFDLHKRIAKVQVKFQGKPIVLHLGIEIYS